MEKTKTGIFSILLELNDDKLILVLTCSNPSIACSSKTDLLSLLLDFLVRGTWARPIQLDKLSSEWDRPIE